MLKCYLSTVFKKTALDRIESTRQDTFEELVSLYPGKCHDGKATRSITLTVGRHSGVLVVRLDERPPAVPSDDHASLA